MAIPQIPDLLRAVLAHSADVEAIPDTTPTGQGVFSYRDGWPVITEVELEAGGIAPDRKFFNEIYRLLSGHTFYTQSGNVYPWVGASESFPGLNYLRGAHVLGSDYQEYVAKKPSGPEIPAEGGGFVGPVNPVGDTSGVWMPVFNISTVEKNGINRPDGVTIKVDDTGILSVSRANLRIPIWMTANRTWYVNGATGDDANTGDSASTAFKTINAAVQYVATYYNIGDSTATIDIANGTYNEKVILPTYARKSGKIRLFGHGGVTIAQSETFAVEASPMAGEWILENLSLSCSLSAVNPGYAESGGINVNSGALVHLVSVAISGSRTAASTNRTLYLLRLQQGGEVRINPGCSITSSGVLAGSWPTEGIVTEGMVWLLGHGLAYGGVALTINGIFTHTLVCSPRGYFRREPVMSATIAGTATGQRYLVEMAGICFVNGGGANYFPGSTAGVVNSNGVYA